jgi:DNA repair protein RadC
MTTQQSNTLASQLPLIDMTAGVSFPKEKRKRKTQKTKVNDMLAQVRQLHEQINTYLHQCPASERPSISSPADAAELLKPFIGNLDHEELWILVLNRRNKVIQLVKLYQGSVNASQVRVGEVFRQAIIEQASAIIIAHDHPSGDPTPSPDDVAVTRAIVQAGKLLDIDVLDHLVVCTDRFVSLKERGLGFGG